MRQNLSATVRKLRRDTALRARPAARAGRLAANMLALAGPSCTRLHAATIRRLVEQEADWIARWNIDTRHYFDLMSLYPALQRAFFIHIPKCGGTSIRQRLVTGYGMAPVPVPTVGATRQSIEYMNAVIEEICDCVACDRESPDLREQYLRSFAAYMVAANPKRIFVLGHQRARELHSLYRQGRDLLFSTVRPPMDILRSMVNYRVDHILNNPQRQDSLELLEAMQLNRDTFAQLVDANPRSVVERLLSIKPLSLVSYLAMDERMSYEVVWQGIRERTVYIAHVSEQDSMLASLFGEAPVAGHRNTSEGRQGLAEAFSSNLRDDWLDSFVESDSIALYERLQSSGIIGFWRDGGSVEEYRQLLGAAAAH